MTAFIQFLATYAVWFYIGGVVGILYGVKMLLDARRQARTSIFALEQEQAGEQSYRAVLVMLVFAGIIGAVSAVNVFLARDVPAAIPPVIRTPTVAHAQVLPTFTLVPTIRIDLPTPFPTLQVTGPVSASASATPTEQTTGAVSPGATSRASGTVTSAAQATRPPPTLPPAAPTVTKVASALPPPVPLTPPDGDQESGEGKAKGALTFSWEWNCGICQLDPKTDAFRIFINYVDSTTKQPRTLAGQTAGNSLRLADMLNGLPETENIYHKATEDRFSWYVVVVRNGAEVSPHSTSLTFYWR